MRLTACFLCAAMTISLLAACSRRSGEPSAPTITVFAAASLTGVLTDLARHYEREHPGCQVQLNFAGSQTLASQLIEGARADIFLSADSDQMLRVISASLAESPFLFTSNQLTLAVVPAAAQRISSVRDLGAPGVRVVLAAEEVPVGQYTRQCLSQLGLLEAVERNAVSYELSAKDVVGKLLAGEADAGFVYVTDIPAAADGLHRVELPASAPVRANYYGARLKGPNPGAADDLLRFLTGPQGAAALRRYNFDPP